MTSVSILCLSFRSQTYISGHSILRNKMREENMNNECSPLKRHRENDTTVAAMDESNDNISSPAQIFVLNNDCFEHIFDWLSSMDLKRLRHICKQMKLISDVYIKLKYPKWQHLTIKNQKSLKIFCKERPNVFKWIKHIQFEDIKFFKSMTVQISHILNQIETLKLRELHIGNRNGDFYDIILKHCHRLKYLSIEYSRTNPPVIGTSNKWLLRHYPTLENFKICIPEPNEWTLQYQSINSEILRFFELNRNIRNFCTNSYLFLKICHMMRESNIKFHNLKIYIDSSNALEYICRAMKEHEFHKQLYIFGEYSEDDVKYLSELHNLKILYTNGSIAMPAMDSVKVLEIFSISFFKHGCMLNDHIKQMAIAFKNVTAISIRFAILNDIRIFLCHCPKLRRISFEHLRVSHEEFMKLDHFVKLDEERKSLNGACKVQILFKEYDFLRLKWEKSPRHEFSLIELKRRNPYDIDFDPFLW